MTALLDSDDEIVHPQSDSSSDSESGDDVPSASSVASGGLKFSKKGKKPEKYSNHAFSEPFGPKIPINLVSPMDIFMLFFTEQFFEIIVLESNRYASQNGIALDLTSTELKAFIGVLVIMGFHSLPSIRLYWSSDPNFHVPRVADIMSLKRFLKILRHIHLNDNEKMPKRNDPNYDKLYKVRLHILYSIKFSAVKKDDEQSKQL